jgi:hypothetical protein
MDRRWSWPVESCCPLFAQRRIVACRKAACTSEPARRADSTISASVPPGGRRRCFPGPCRKKDRLLAYQGHFATPVARTDPAGTAPSRRRAGLRVEETQSQKQQRGFARAGRPDSAIFSPGGTVRLKTAKLGCLAGPVGNSTASKTNAPGPAARAGAAGAGGLRGLVSIAKRRSVAPAVF